MRESRQLLRGRGMVWLVGVLVLASGVLLAGHPIIVAAQGTLGAPAVSRDTCGYGPTQRMSQVSDSAVREASALVASQQWPGIYWTFNDSGNAPTVYAFDEDGQPRGAFVVSNATNVDWEAMQLGPDGDGGYALYIGDIGDNKQRRHESVIYRVLEPEPAADGGQVSASTTAPATAFRFVYPVVTRNVEAMLVHPQTGEIVLISRGLTGFSMVYRLPLPLDSGHAMRADLVGTVDMRALGTHDGQVTDATLSQDGQHVVLRTNTRMLVYDVPSWAPWWRAWAQEPRVYRLEDGPKGEGSPIAPGSEDLVSIGEGVSPPLFLIPWQC